MGARKTTFNFVTEHEMRSAKGLEGSITEGGVGCDTLI